MPALQLTTEQRKTLRASAHHLDPVVMIGNEGLSPAVHKELDVALDAHGLIKVRVLSDSREQRTTLLADAADRAGRRGGAAHRQAAGAVAAAAAQSQGAARRRPHGGAPHGAPRQVFEEPDQRPTIKKVKVFGNQRVTAGGMIKRAKRRAASIKKKRLA